MFYHCCVQGCTANSKKWQLLHKYPWMEGVTFHSIPIKYRNTWVILIWRENLTSKDITKWTRICSRHFVDKRPTGQHPFPELFPYNNYSKDFVEIESCKCDVIFDSGIDQSQELLCFGGDDVVCNISINLAVSTQVTYRYQVRAYINVCGMMGYAPIPADPVNLGRYLAYLGRCLKPSSIRLHTAVIRLLHLDYGTPNPFEQNWFLTSILCGIRRVKGDNTCQKLPVTPQLLLRLRAHLDLTTSLDITFWAACLVMFFFLLCKANVFPPTVGGFDPALHLTRADIAKSTPPLPTGLILTSRWSKNHTV